MSRDRRSPWTWIEVFAVAALAGVFSWLAASQIPHGHLPILLGALVALAAATIDALFLQRFGPRGALSVREQREARGFRDIMNSPHEGLWRFDAEGKLIEVNRRLAEML